MTDFGFACLRKQPHETGDHLRRSQCGSAGYNPPQVVSSTWYSEKRDLWSVGVIMYQLLEGSYPYESAPEVQRNHKQRLLQYATMSSQCKG